MIAHALLAQVYGAGVYDSSKYGAPTVQIGPLILPATGAGIIAIISVAVIAIGVGLFIWARERRRRQSIR